MGIRTAIMGIGNLLLMDEGAGVHAVNALKDRYTFPGEVELIDGGTMGLDLLPYLEDKDALLLIDAVDFSAGPGTVRVMEGGDVRVFLDMKFSVHQIGIPDLLFAASFSGVAPPRLCLVGIQPHVIETGVGMSGALREHFEDLLDTTVEKLRSWGLEVRETAHVSGDTVQDS